MAGACGALGTSKGISLALGCWLGCLRSYISNDLICDSSMLFAFRIDLLVVYICYIIVISFDIGDCQYCGNVCDDALMVLVAIYYH